MRSLAAQRGDDVHERLEGLLSDPWWSHRDIASLDGEDGWLRSAAQFLRRVVDPLLVEASLFSESHGFAGTLDLLAGLDDGLFALVDWKTSAAKKRREWIGDYELQAAAYRQGLAESYGVTGCDRAMIVVLYEDEQADVFEMDESALDAAWLRFGVRLATYRSMT